MEEDTITSSLQELTELLEVHYEQQVVVLIDEYDVPMAKAHENGYYDEMVLLLRNMFGNVLKTNSSIFYISIHFVGMQYNITLGNPCHHLQAAVHKLNSG